MRSDVNEIWEQIVKGNQKEARSKIEIGVILIKR